MGFWLGVLALIAGVLALAGGLRAFGLWLGTQETEQRIDRRDHARIMEQRRWIEGGEITRMTFYEAVYDADERIAEDAARMEQLGFYVAFQAESTDGRQLKVVYQREGVLAAL